MVCITRQNAEARLKSLHETGIITKVKLQPLIKEAKETIIEALEQANRPVIAFSGGKDSLVVLDLVRQINHDVVGVFENTTNEYNETVEYVHSLDNIVELHPEKSFWQCVKEYGLPEPKATSK